MMMRTGDCVKGVVLGLLVGVGVYCLCSDSCKRSRKRLKRKANKALQGARCLWEDMSELMHI